MMMTSHWCAAVVVLAMARPDGCDAFATNTLERAELRKGITTKIRSTISLFASPSIGIFFGTSTGSTEEVAHLISAEFGDASSEPIEM
jgi:hypothetical protein